VRKASLDYLRGLRAVCDEFGLLLLFDEVQTGMGRTGKLFAYEWSGIAPDVMGLAKGLGGGFPLGALLATDKAAAGMTAGLHGSTFGGNPLAMAVGNAVLDVLLEAGFMDRVGGTARKLLRGLEELAARHPLIIDEVRGAGLLIGLHCAVPNGELVAKLMEQGLLSVPAAENVVRLLPPLILDEAQVDEALGILDRVCADWARAA
jgi:acetylornithine/N-succinyldiaminopimelate aminotransferase